MRKLFYTSTERRIRAPWRIVLHTLFVAAVTLLFVIVASMLIIDPNSMVIQEGAGDLSDIQAQEGGAIPTEAQLELLSRLTAVGLVGVLGLSLVVFGRWIDRRPVGDYGMWLRSAAWWRDLAFGLVLGALLIAAVFVVEMALGWVSITGTFATSADSFGGAMFWLVMTFLSVGIYEELLSRGYHLLNLAEWFNGRWLGERGALLVGWGLSSLVFGMLHAANPNASLISTLNIAVAGLFLGMGYVLTRSLAIPIGVHITWNFFLGGVFGFPVSGALTGVTVIEVEQLGPDVWTGGAFGPEAGLIGLLAMLAGMAAVYGYVRATHGAARLQTQIAAYTPPSLQPNHPNLQASDQSTEPA